MPGRFFYDWRQPFVVPEDGRVTDVWQQWLDAIFGSLGTLRSQITQLLGVHSGVLGDAPTNLTADDVGYLYTVTSPYYHTVRWTGAAWDWLDGDRPGRFAYYQADPGGGWQLCDGTVTDQLTVGATLGTAALTAPNVGADRILKTSAAYTGALEAAVNTGSADPTITLSGNTDLPVPTVLVDNDLLGSTVSVAKGNCVHALDPGVAEQAAHDHTPGMPASLGALLYVRR